MATLANGLPAPGAAELRARAGRENFPVALALLSRAQRAHLTALYGFARLADDVGDEAQGDRLALLDELEADLDRVFAGEEPRHPVLQRLAPTVRELRLPEQPFRLLIEAGRRDQRVSRYATWSELREYCAHLRESRRTAGPARLRRGDSRALRARPTRSAPRSSWSSTARTWPRISRAVGSTCPARTSRASAATKRDLRAPTASPAVRELISFEVARVRALLDLGAPLARTLAGRPRLAIAGFIAGGLAAADAIERRGFDVLSGAPRPRRRDLLRRLVAAL